MISYIIPTRDRPERLNLTLAALGSLRGHPDGSEVVIVDNASAHLPTPPPRLPNGLTTQLIIRNTNEGAASRNAAVAASSPRHDWIVMLDDDSYPCDTGFIRRLFRAPPDVAAVSADIYLPGHARRESGGLPEVFVGCGVAIRRDVFLRLGGYDPAFNYYAEEYDLAARMLLAGYRIAFDPWFRVEHHKVAAGRDMNTILARLVRNNGWVMQRYAPENLRRAQVREQRTRYRQIAHKESATEGFRRGLLDLRSTIRHQPRTPLPHHLFDRFTGLHYARQALQHALSQSPFKTAAIIDEGKNGWVIRKALAELGVTVVTPWPWGTEGPRPQALGPSRTVEHASSSLGPRAYGRGPSHDVLIVGSMSPGPMLDSWERHTLRVPLNGSPQAAGGRVIAPWLAITHKPAAGSDILLRIPA